jgi:hypothetical protein
VASNGKAEAILLVEDVLDLVVRPLPFIVPVSFRD